VPGNLVYFKVLVNDPGELSLKTADGKEIPASIRMVGQDRVYAPIEPIPADTVVVLTYPSNTCGWGQASKLTYLFQTRQASNLQLQAAQLTVSEYGLVSAGPTEFATDVGPIAFQHLAYGSLDAAGATTHLIDIDVSVDGEQRSPFSSMSWDSLIKLRAVCTKSAPTPQPIGLCHDTVFGPGHHSVTAQPHIVGQPDPPATQLDVDFDLACGLCQAATSPALRSDAGASDEAPATNSLDVAKTDSSSLAQGTSAPSGTSGCSAAGRSTGSGAAWLVMIALACSRRRPGR
jgi:hypothetical protein